MHATLHDFSFSDEELLHLGNHFARHAARLSIPVLSRSSTVSTFQLLQLHHFKFCWFSPEKSASYGSAGLAPVLPVI
jgi:hypothetical protein